MWNVKIRNFSLRRVYAVWGVDENFVKNLNKQTSFPFKSIQVPTYLIHVLSIVLIYSMASQNIGKLMRYFACYLNYHQIEQAISGFWCFFDTKLT